MSNTLKIGQHAQYSAADGSRKAPDPRREQEQERDAEEQLDRDSHQGEGGELVELARQGDGDVHEQERGHTERRGQHPADGGPGRPRLLGRLLRVVHRTGVRTGRGTTGRTRRAAGAFTAACAGDRTGRARSQAL